MENVRTTGKPEVLETAIEILLNQSADSTMKNSLNHFLKWKIFAEIRGFPVLPKGKVIQQSFSDNFDLFIVHQYNFHKHKKYKNGRVGSNGPAAFKAVFTGINHIIENLFDSPRIETPFLAKAKRTYSRICAGSNITKKAKPLEFHHIRNLVNLAKTNQEPFVQLTVKVIITGWFAAGRWACIDAIDIAKTLSDDGLDHQNSAGINPDPSGKFSYIYWKNRKHLPGLSFSVLPTMDDKSVDPRKCFLDVVSMFNRQNSTKLIPQVSKRGSVWIVNPDPKLSCKYNQFLKMFRQVMLMAGNDMEAEHCDSTTPTTKWTLHSGRRGFVKTARAASGGNDPLLWEVIIRHGGWKPTSIDTVFGYNDVDPAVHAAKLYNMYSQTMLTTPESSDVTPRKRPRLEGRSCLVKQDKIWLPGFLLLNTLPTGSSHCRVRIGRTIQTIPSESIRLVGI